MKDTSDTEIALRLCLDLHRKEIIILGGTGTRIDHIWANVQSLKIALDAGADARILDSHNQIRLLKDKVCLKRRSVQALFSVFSLGGTIEGVNIVAQNIPCRPYPFCPMTASV